MASLISCFLLMEILDCVLVSAMSIRPTYHQIQIQIHTQRDHVWEDTMDTFNMSSKASINVYWSSETTESMNLACLPYVDGRSSLILIRLRWRWYRMTWFEINLSLTTIHWLSSLQTLGIASSQVPGRYYLTIHVDIQYVHLYLAVMNLKSISPTVFPCMVAWKVSKPQGG